MLGQRQWQALAGYNCPGLVHAACKPLWVAFVEETSPFQLASQAVPTTRPAFRDVEQAMQELSFYSGMRCGHSALMFPKLVLRASSPASVGWHDGLMSRHAQDHAD